MKYPLLALLVLSSYTVTLAGCASTQRSFVLGASIGAAGGAAIGHAASDGRSSGTVIGALVGAATGGLFGYLAHKEKEKQSLASQFQVPDDKVPALTKPQYHCVWKRDTIEGNRLEKSHMICIIDRQSEWSSQ